MATTDRFETGHVGINVRELERSVRFYGEVFGFERVGGETAEGGRYAFLGGDGRLVLTLWEQASEGFDAGRAGLHHLSFEVADVAAVEAARGRAERAGARFLYDGIVPHAEGASSGGVFFEDPDGTRLEIFTPRGAEDRPAASHGPACGFF